MKTYLSAKVAAKTLGVAKRDLKLLALDGHLSGAAEVHFDVRQPDVVYDPDEVESLAIILHAAQNTRGMSSTAAAAVLKVSRDTVIRRIQSGDLAGYQVSRDGATLKPSGARRGSWVVTDETVLNVR